MYLTEASTSNFNEYNAVKVENDSEVQYTRLSKEIIMALLNGLNYTNKTLPDSQVTDGEEDISASIGLISPLAMRISLYLICVVGIILNLAVFCKRKFTM